MTIPNMITVMRFLLVPCVVFALLSSEWGWAFAGFVIAGVSDGVDGYIARRFNQRSELGAYMDPIADKALLVSVFIMLGYLGQVPLWLVVLAVSRDVLIIGGVLLATVMGKPVAMKPFMVSKINTAVQIMLAALILGENAFGYDSGWLRTAVIWSSGLLTVASAAAYLVAWLRHMTHGESTSDHG